MEKELKSVGPSSMASGGSGLSISFYEIPGNKEKRDVVVEDLFRLANKTYPLANTKAEHGLSSEEIRIGLLVLGNRISGLKDNNTDTLFTVIGKSSAGDLLKKTELKRALHLLDVHFVKV